MSAVTVTAVVRPDPSDDAIDVTGMVDGVPVTARGWMSAMANHLPPEAFDADGNRIPAQDADSPDGVKRDADGGIVWAVQPREMTQEERMIYWQDLLQQGAPAIPAQPQVLFGS